MLRIIDSLERKNRKENFHQYPDLSLTDTKKC